ncbi:MAG: efflux RND transporter periplasmic adaptor subunit, partial [Myxococcota bacterium]
EIGIRNDDVERLELRSGISPGDVVLVGAARDVAPGTPVEVRAPGAPAADSAPAPAAPGAAPATGAGAAGKEG